MSDVYIEFNYCENSQCFMNEKRVGGQKTLSLLPYNLYVGLYNVFLTYNGRMTPHCADDIIREIRRFEIYNQKNNDTLKKESEIDFNDYISSSKMNSLINMIGINFSKWNIKIKCT